MNQQQIKEWILKDDNWKNAMAAGALNEDNLIDYFFATKALYLKNNVPWQDVDAAASQAIAELVQEGKIEGGQGRWGWG